MVPNDRFWRKADITEVEKTDHQSLTRWISYIPGRYFFFQIARVTRLAAS